MSVPTTPPRHRARHLVTISALLAALTGLSPGRAEAGSLSGRQVLVYHACDVPPCADPRSHMVYLATSNGSRRFAVPDDWEAYAGSVPDVVVRDQTVYVYTARELRRGIDRGARWLAPEALEVRTASGEVFQGVDPSAIVVGGRLYLYLMEGATGRDPARCAPGEKSCVKRFFVGREVQGSNGARFVLDSAPALEVPIAGTGDTASDPDVFDLPGGGFGLLISRGMAIDAYTSTTPTGPWTPLGRLVEQGGGGVPSAVATRHGLWLYVTARDPATGVESIRRARLDDLGEVVDPRRFRTIYPGVWGRAAVSSPSVALTAPDPPATPAP